MSVKSGRPVAILGAMLACCVWAGAQGTVSVWDPVRTYDFNAPEDALEKAGDAVAAVIGNPEKAQAVERAMIDVLKDPSATFAAKQFVCRQLVRIGTDRSVPVLAAMLADEKLGDTARYALGRYPGATAGKALRDAAETLKGRLLVGVINTLGERRDAKAVPYLTKRVGGNDAKIAAACACALGRIGTLEALRVLQSLPNKRDPTIARAAIECAYAVSQAGGTVPAGDVFDGIYADAGYDENVRIAALGGLLVTRPEKATAILVKQFSGPDDKLRLAASKYVRDFPGADATRAFAGQIPSLAPEPRMLLITALADRGDSAAVPAVLKCASHVEPGVRLSALKALGPLNAGAAACPVLLAKAASGSAEEMDAARRSLLLTRGRGVDAALIEAMVQGPTDVRVEAITALSGRGAVSATPALLAAASDAHEEIRNAALDGLCKLAGAADMDPLAQLVINARNDKERDRAAKALAVAARKVSEPEERADPVLAAMANAPVECKAAFLGVLARTGGKRALQTVEAATQNREATVRDAAVRALAEWCDATAIEPVLKAAETARDAKHRVIALRGLARLMGEPGTRTPDQTMAIYKRAFDVAASADERKALLPGISTVSSPSALNLLSPMREDPALGAEVLLAMANITRAMAASYPEEARVAADKLLAQNLPEAVRAGLRETVNFLERYEDFVVTWYMSEVYKRQGKSGRQLFDVVFTPERDPGAGKWRVVAANDSDVILNLDPLGGDDQVVYLKAELSVPKASQARLEIGSDDGVKAWIDGKLVHANNATRPVAIGSDKVNVSLKAGSNLLLLKIVEGKGNMGACCRVRAADGSPLPGLSMKPTTDQVQGSL